MRISDWSSDVCSSDLGLDADARGPAVPGSRGHRDRRRPQLAAEPALEHPHPPVRQPDPPAWAGFGRSRRHHLGRLREIGRAHVELQSLMRISYAVFCLKKKNNKKLTDNTSYLKQLS